MATTMLSETTSSVSGSATTIVGVDAGEMAKISAPDPDTWRSPSFIGCGVAAASTNADFSEIAREPSRCPAPKEASGAPDVPWGWTKKTERYSLRIEGDTCRDAAGESMKNDGDEISHGISMETTAFPPVIATVPLN